MCGFCAHSHFSGDQEKADQWLELISGGAQLAGVLIGGDCPLINGGACRKAREQQAQAALLNSQASMMHVQNEQATIALRAYATQAPPKKEQPSFWLIAGGLIAMAFIGVVLYARLRR